MTRSDLIIRLCLGSMKNLVNVVIVVLQKHLDEASAVAAKELAEEQLQLHTKPLTGKLQKLP